MIRKTILTMSTNPPKGDQNREGLQGHGRQRRRVRHQGRVHKGVQGPETGTGITNIWRWWVGDLHPNTTVCQHQQL